MKTYKDYEYLNFEDKPQRSILRLFSNKTDERNSYFQFYPESGPKTALWAIFDDIEKVALDPLMNIVNIQNTVENVKLHKTNFEEQIKQSKQTLQTMKSDVHQILQ